MPIAINASARPPSSSPVQGSPPPGGAPRTTTTSRRGGRTRARSPAVMGNRLPPPNGNNDSMTGAGENPSSAAAAAAAAAAKTLSSAGGNGRPPPPPGSWSEVNRREDMPPFHPAYSGSKLWPDESRTGYRGGPPRRYGYREDPNMMQYRQVDDYDRRYRGERHRPPHYDGDKYRGNPRGPPPPGYYHPDYRYAHVDGRVSKPRGGTSLVLGGATPIHVPKPEDPMERPSRDPSSTRVGPDSRSAASVFRGRPDGSDRKSDSAVSDEGRQKSLLSLRTPTMSFDKEKKSDDSPDHAEKKIESDGKSNLDMAPSFSLFNQSFDSFGDVQYFAVDSTLNNDSFGMSGVPSLGGDNEGVTQLLQRDPSAGNFSGQLLGASASGGLTIGYSPVNSFGNASATVSRRGSNMMIVGGNDPRSSSPSDMLNVYRVQSGGAPRSMDDGYLRSSMGSFGGHSVQQQKPYMEAHPGYYYGMEGVRSHDGGERGPFFYAFLRRHKSAFAGCTFLLPGLKEALLNSTGEENTATDEHTNYASPRQPSVQDLAVARRRVDSSVCAFGGNLHYEKPPLDEKETTGDDKKEIFRSRSKKPKGSTGLAAAPSAKHMSAAKTRYAEALPGRFYENDQSRLSWEFEENPPVEIDQSKESTSTTTGKRERSTDDDGKSVGDSDSVSEKRNTPSPASKTRYRCKLCGQPKQNHNCPYRESLARSIGVMVFPSVNAFNADEPGSITANLAEMNNFTDIPNDIGRQDMSPTRPTPERRRSPTSSGPSQVTPDSMRSSPRVHSSPTSMPTTSSGSRGTKRGITGFVGAMDDHRDRLFSDTMELSAEQYRTVTPMGEDAPRDSYHYPALPLPYAQRKRLSDNLFSLSNEVPKLTDECAVVLREAREKDMWDLAVAELMTQVVVAIHCNDMDHCFEGLRQYLLTLGIAC